MVCVEPKQTSHKLWNIVCGKLIDGKIRFRKKKFLYFSVIIIFS